MTEWMFGLAGGILLVLSVLGMILVLVPQGIVMLGIASEYVGGFRCLQVSW